MTSAGQNDATEDLTAQPSTEDVYTLSNDDDVRRLRSRQNSICEGDRMGTLWVANGSRITLRSSDGARQTMRASEEIITAPARTSRSFGADGDDGKVDRDSVK